MQKQNIKIVRKAKIQSELKSLKKELAKVKLEKNILEKCAGCLQTRTQVKFEFIDQHLSCFPVKDMCRILNVSTSGYYKWRSKTLSKREQHNLVLLEEIKKIHYRNKKRYGSPRIAKELEASGFHASEKLIRKLMKSASLQSVFKRKFKTTTDSSHKYPVAENILDRGFSVNNKNEVWVSDITYIKSSFRWLYLTVIIDLFDRTVIGWALSTSLSAKHTSLKALDMAITNSPVNNSPLIFHSDKGIQYACKEFINELSKYKTVIRSMSRKGNCWDNAVSESFFKTLKVELVFQNNYQTKQQAESSISEYIETFYNISRRHSQLNNMTILEYRKT
ncbi:IS3 family transposase [Flavobacterium suzhouense]|uniref:IS3 family transposase n=1 Tax=Flavobacterium suzhouense TaxID=1529638 RepID=A0ABW5NWJ7_9FLAO